jgi:hypothetical protein
MCGEGMRIKGRLSEDGLPSYLEGHDQGGQGRSGGHGFVERFGFLDRAGFATAAGVVAFVFVFSIRAFRGEVDGMVQKLGSDAVDT